MDLLPCLSDSISEFVSGTEAHEVLRFVGCECADFDAKDVCDFMGVLFDRRLCGQDAVFLGCHGFEIRGYATPQFNQHAPCKRGAQSVDAAHLGCDGGVL